MCSSDLVGFGGAYALLPYINQAAVQFGWLTPSQMMDGLALGETTPGPLLMIVEFVGYLASGSAGAAVAVWFTFLPSFFFVLAGAPLVEHVASSRRFAGPLRAITAAVAGVIANLAVLFGRNVLTGVEPVVLASVALVALLYFKRSAVETIVGGAVGGLALALS